MKCLFSLFKHEKESKRGPCLFWFGLDLKKWKITKIFTFIMIDRIVNNRFGWFKKHFQFNSNDKERKNRYDLDI